MTDPDKTDPNLSRYLRADGWFDRHIGGPLTASPWSLVFVALALVAAFILGAWAGMP